MEIKKKFLKNSTNLKNFLIVTLILLITYIDLITDLIFSKINYISISLLSYYLPYFYLFLRSIYFYKICLL